MYRKPQYSSYNLAQGDDGVYMSIDVIAATRSRDALISDWERSATPKLDRPHHYYRESSSRDSPPSSSTTHVPSVGTKGVLRRNLLPLP